MPFGVLVQVQSRAPPKDDSFDTKCREKSPRFFGGFSLPMHQFCLNDNPAAWFRYAIFYIPHSATTAHCTNFFITSDDFWCMASISHTAFSLYANFISSNSMRLKKYAPHVLHITFSTITVATQHLAVLGNSLAALAPWRNVIGFHFADFEMLTTF